VQTLDPVAIEMAKQLLPEVRYRIGINMEPINPEPAGWEFLNLVITAIATGSYGLGFDVFTGAPDPITHHRQARAPQPTPTHRWIQLKGLGVDLTEAMDLDVFRRLPETPLPPSPIPFELAHPTRQPPPAPVVTG
jgi:hypothetical protein